jgi:predicted transposase YdaD
VLVLLKPPAAGTEIETEFHVENTRHAYQVICMWEQDPEIFLADEALLPLAILAASDRPEQLLSRVAQQVSMIEPREQRQEIATRVQLLAGLKFDKQLIQQFFRGEAMRESVIYQDILQEGRQEGRQEGESTLVLRQLTRRVGEIPAEVRSQIQALPLLDLEELGEALLDFTELVDLMTWLEM